MLASSCLSARPSVRMEQLGFHWKDFYETWSCSFFLKSVEKIQISLKYDKNSGTVLHMETGTRYLAQSFLKWGMFQKNILEETQTKDSGSISYFRKMCRLWSNVEKYIEPDRPQTTVWRTRIECWVPKATNTQSVQGTLLFQCNSGLTNAPQCWVIRTVHCLVVHTAIPRLTSDPANEFFG